MTDFCKGQPQDKAEIIDFINYVFSQAHNPHDFKTLIPKSFADHVDGMAAEHYLARQDGRIRASVSNRIIRQDCCGQPLCLGLIGNVSVHPYSRGEGLMRRLMHWAIQESREKGVDLMVLGGQRQRYGYYGFTTGGPCAQFTVSPANIRHALADTDTAGITFEELTAADTARLDYAWELYHRRPVHAVRPRAEFLDIAHTWCLPCRAVLRNGEMIGYVIGTMAETVLENEADYPAVLKAYFEQFRPGTFQTAATPTQPQRRAFLASICESSAIETLELIKVLRWQPVLQALLTVRAAVLPLQDGALALQIDGQSMTVRVRQGVPAVTDGLPDPAEQLPLLTLTQDEAQEKFFGNMGLLTPPQGLYNWAPLPFWLDLADAY